MCLGQRRADDADDETDGDNGSGDGGVQEYDKKRWNLNLPFQLDRSEDRLRPEMFDVVHSRFLADGIDTTRWQAYIADIRRLLRRRGWIQMVELIPHFQSGNGRLRDDSHLTTWWMLYSQALTQTGKNVRIARELERLLAREGFDNIRATPYDLPVGTWHPSMWPLVCKIAPSADKMTDQRLGRDNRILAKEMLRSLSTWPLLHHQRMTPAQFQSLITGATRELDDDSLRLYYKL